MSTTSSQFDKLFLQKFPQLGRQTYQKYTPTLETYQKIIIPFQTRRMKQNQSLSFKNASLQRQKLQQIKKIQQLSNDTSTKQSTLQLQSNKIIDLQHTVIDLQNANNMNKDQIQALKLNTAELQASLNQKIYIVKQVQNDKSQVLKNYQERSKECEILGKNYVRDRDIIQEKIKYIQELENGLLLKDRELEEKQFYLKKKWQELQQSKKQLQRQKNKQIPTPLKHPSRSNSRTYQQQQPEPIDQKSKHQRIQILKNPIKKLVKHHNNQIYDLSFNYNGNLLATCGGDRMIKLYDVVSFRNGAVIQSNSVDIYLCVQLDYTGERLLAGSTDKSVHVYSTSTGKQLHSFVGHGYKVNSVSWTSAKQKCISGSQDKQIKVWQIQKASNILSIPCGKPVRYVSCNSVQPVIYSGHSDGSVRLYSINQNTTPIAQIKGIIDYPINSVAVLGNRSQLIVSSQQGSPIYLIDLKMNKLLKKYQAKDYYNTLVRADLSPSQKYVIAGNCDGYIYYWNKDKQNMEKRISGHQCTITTLKYHFMNNMLASCDKEGNVIIWQ